MVHPRAAQCQGSYVDHAYKEHYLQFIKLEKIFPLVLAPIPPSRAYRTHISLVETKRIKHKGGRVSL